MSEQPKIVLEIPRFETTQERSFAGTSRRFTHETMREISVLWNEVGPNLGSIPGGIGQAAYGMAFDMATSDQGFEYMAGVEVGNLAQVPDSYRKMTIPARTYVVFTHAGHASLIGATCGAIWEQWFPESGYEPRHDDNAPDLIEYYGPGFDPVTGSGDTEIWIPVNPRH